jgi:hypothetical protein
MIAEARADNKDNDVQYMKPNSHNTRMAIGDFVKYCNSEEFGVLEIGLHLYSYTFCWWDSQLPTIHTRARQCSEHNDTQQVKPSLSCVFPP